MVTKTSGNFVNTPPGKKCNYPDVTSSGRSGGSGGGGRRRRRRRRKERLWVSLLAPRASCVGKIKNRNRITNIRWKRERDEGMKRRIERGKWRKLDGGLV